MTARARKPSVHRAVSLTRRGFGALLCGLVVLSAGAGTTFAQAQMAQPATAPLPPRRPASLPAIPAPDTPAMPAAPPESSPTPVSAPDEAPASTRAQLRACSLEWQKMKKSGEAYGIIWRDFARTCIPRQEP